MSKLLKALADEIRRGNLSLKERLWKYGNAFLNGAEISAQEAVYGLLGMVLVLSSRDCIFIPTRPPRKRTGLLKSTAGTFR